MSLVSNPAVEQLSTLEAKYHVENRPGMPVIDLTDEDEYQRTSLPRAVNIPWDGPGGDFDTKIAEAAPDKSARVLIYGRDRSDDRAADAARRMQHLGYTQILHLGNGKIGWMEHGLPTE